MHIDPSIALTQYREHVHEAERRIARLQALEPRRDAGAPAPRRRLGRPRGAAAAAPETSVAPGMMTA